MSVHMYGVNSVSPTSQQTKRQVEELERVDKGAGYDPCDQHDITCDEDEARTIDLEEGSSHQPCKRKGSRNASAIPPLDVV